MNGYDGYDLDDGLIGVGLAALIISTTAAAIYWLLQWGSGNR